MAELMRRHWDSAVFLAARILRSPELARDAAQEAAIAALTDLGRLRSPDRFGAWFCGIALNVSRRWRRQLRAEVPVADSDHPSALPGPAEAAEIADLAASVRAAIAALPEGQRQAVWLFYLQGLGHREVAAELDISIGAVKARLHQARAGLAPRLAQVIDIREVRAMAATAEEQWAEVSVQEIRRSEGQEAGLRKHVMILKERGVPGRVLPIWIGPAEAAAMALALESAETPRPFAARLAASLVEAAGSGIEEVRITRLLDKVYYASVLVRGPAGTAEVDARPSDAVNLALAAEAPIRVDIGLLGVTPAALGTDEAAAYPVATASIAAETRERLRREVSDP